MRRRLQRILKSAPRWIEYRPADLILNLLYVLIAGIQRRNKTEILQYNGLFLTLVGLETIPDQSALRRLLWRMPPPAVREIVRLHDRLRSELFALPRLRSQLEFHLDSVTLTIYGQQQGAPQGYNPRKNGRPSRSSQSLL